MPATVVGRGEKWKGFYISRMTYYNHNGATHDKGGRLSESRAEVSNVCESAVDNGGSDSNVSSSESMLGENSASTRGCSPANADVVESDYGGTFDEGSPGSDGIELQYEPESELSGQWRSEEEAAMASDEIDGYMQYVDELSDEDEHFSDFDEEYGNGSTEGITMKETIGKQAHLATPVMMVNLNLKPDKRFKSENVLISMIIPGPKAYDDLNSFLAPLVDELNLLSDGVPNVGNIYTQTRFTLRGYLLFVSGDGRAVADAMQMSQPGNARRPYRAYEIEAIRDKKIWRGIGESLVQSKKGIPNMMERIPQDIKKILGYFKAKECKVWLLTYAAPMLYTVPGFEVYINNFEDLRKLYKISRQRAISYAELLEVTRLSKQFLLDFEKLYYRAQYIKDLGPASVFDAAPIERAIEVMKEQVRGMGNIGANLSNSVLMRDLLNHAPINASLAKERVKHVRPLIKGEILKACLSRFKRVFAQYNVEAYEPRFFKRGRTDHGLLIGSRLSQRDAESNREDYRVCWRDNESWVRRYGEVEYFCEAREYEDMAVVEVYEAVTAYREGSFVAIEERYMGRPIYIGTNTILGLVGKLTDSWTERGKMMKRVYLVGEMCEESDSEEPRFENGYWENNHNGWRDEGADNVSLQRLRAPSEQDDDMMEEEEAEGMDIERSVI
ncbi:hypothetical protein DID88_001027 [Monilinia fructigena]|uniref:Uncharacterized protein n=1 Tax=Monilinia fructigena TaxID=38457 RepID=A0A395IZ78_9HELO|nr:hypothetical protein DID88_001027 [Monilinia fructigena]